MNDRRLRQGSLPKATLADLPLVPGPAPALFADGVTAVSIHGGQVQATFEATVFDTSDPARAKEARVVVLNLRMPVNGASDFHQALGRALLMGRPS